MPGTAKILNDAGVAAKPVLKVYEGRPNILDMLKNRTIALMVNTASGRKTVADSKELRQATLLYGVPYTTTVAGAAAIAQAIRELKQSEVGVRSLQEFYAG